MAKLNLFLLCCRFKSEIWVKKARVPSYPETFGLLKKVRFNIQKSSPPSLKISGLLAGAVAIQMPRLLEQPTNRDPQIEQALKYGIIRSISHQCRASKPASAGVPHMGDVCVTRV